jgi:hypothetical protein
MERKEYLNPILLIITSFIFVLWTLYQLKQELLIETLTINEPDRISVGLLY